MAFIKRLPLAMSGLALALASLGNLLQGYSLMLRGFCGALSTVILLGLTLRILSDNAAVRKELDNVVACSTFPAYFMANMMLSTYIAPWAYTLAFAWWLLSLAGHLVWTIFFSWRYLRNFNINNVFPSWFLVYVSYAIASITSPIYGMQTRIGQPIFYIGFCGYLVTLPLVCYRVFFVRQLPESAKPVMGIFMAPANLCLVGYLASFDQRNEIIITFLFGISLLIAGCFLLYLPQIFKLPFYPSYSGLTFPLVVFATNLKQINAVYPNGVLASFETLAKWLATVMVVYVLCRYVIFLWPHHAVRSLRKEA